MTYETLDWMFAADIPPDVGVSVIAEHGGCIFMAYLHSMGSHAAADDWRECATDGPCRVTWWSYVLGPNPKGA